MGNAFRPSSQSASHQSSCLPFNCQRQQVMQSSGISCLVSDPNLYLQSGSASLLLFHPLIYHAKISKPVPCAKNFETIPAAFMPILCEKFPNFTRTNSTCEKFSNQSHIRKNIETCPVISFQIIFVFLLTFGTA